MPSLLRAATAAILLSLTAATASAGCPDTGAVQVFTAREHDGFSFYYLLGPQTFRFIVPGKAFRLDDKRLPGRALYLVDDKTLQIQRVDRKSFASWANGKGEQATLDAQARYEQDHIRKALPKARITDLGSRTRTDDDGRNAKLFRLWSYEMAGSMPTYFLSSLIDQDTVVMLTAILPGSPDAALDELRTYAGSLHPVPAEHCAKIKWN